MPFRSTNPESSAACLWCRLVALNSKFMFNAGRNKSLVQLIFKWQKDGTQTPLHQNHENSSRDWNWIGYNKYLGIIIDLNFVFKIHTEKLVFKLKLKWSFFLWNKFSSSLQARKYLISATFLSQYFLDYSDLFFLNASDQCLPLCFMFYYWMWKLHDSLSVCPQTFYQLLSKSSLSAWAGVFLSVYMCI